jgi:hypothetical protein
MKIIDPLVQIQTDILIKEISGMTDEQIKKEQERLNSQQDRFDKGAHLAETLSNLVNSMSHDDEIRGFAEAMKRTHRTLQQSSFQFFLIWSFFIADNYNLNDIDPRNEAMVQTAKNIKKYVYSAKLPLI